MAGTWATLANAPPAAVCTTFLLTDGTVLAQGVSTNHWYRLTPDASGSYAERHVDDDGRQRARTALLRVGRSCAMAG